MRLGGLLGHLALVAGCVVVGDDAGAASPSRCVTESAAGNWKAAAVACRSTYRANPSAENALALSKAEMNVGNDAEALSLAQRADHGASRPAALLQIGALLNRSGELDRARDTLAEARALAWDRGDHGLAARASYAMASSHRRAGRYKETLADLEAARQDASKIPGGGDRRLLGLVSLMTGDVMRAVGHDDLAERHYREADERLATSRTDRAYLLLKIGMLHRSSGRRALAVVAFEEALAMAREDGLREVEQAALLNLAYSHHLEGDAEAGLARLARWSKPNDVSYLYNRAMLEADRGALAEAARLLDEAARLATGDEWSWDIAYERGRIAERMGDLALAERSYRASIATVERMRAAFDESELQPWVLARRREPYEALFTLVVGRPDTPTKLEVLESFTARSFLDSLVRSRGADPESALRHADAVGAMWKRLRAQPDESDLPSGLGAREVLVHVTARGRLWAVHRMSNGDLEFHDRGDAGQVRHLAEKLIADPDAATIATELGEMLIPAGVTASTDVLYLVPTGPLLALPYAALRRADRLLVEERAIAYAPSLLSLAGAPAARSSRDAMIVADADGTLPSARDEALRLGRVLDVRPYTGGEATRQRLTNAGSLRLLHVATHAGVDADGAWMRLADGNWSTREVLDSKLRADVVVLAGCASASTRYEEMWGSLAAAFLANGSGAVVATLGSVDDRDARAVMMDAYQRGLATQPARALAATQREMARTLPAHRWASFVVYGSSTFDTTHPVYR